MDKYGATYSAVPMMTMPPVINCLRIIVSEEAAKKIVGQNGYELERIRNQVDGAINIDGDKGLPASVTFQSTKEQILWAFGEMVQHMSSKPPHLPHLPLNSELVVNILMPENICGFFIGKGGVVIKNLSKQYGLFMRVEHDCLPQSNEKVLVVAGLYTKIDKLIEYLLVFYEQHKMDLSTVRFYYTNNEVSKFSAEQNPVPPASNAYSNSAYTVSSTNQGFMVTGYMSNVPQATASNISGTQQPGNMSNSS